MKGGFFKLPRDWRDDPVFSGAYDRASAFAWMIEAAAFRDYDVFVGGKLITLKRGQFSHSLRFMAKKFKWSEAKVRRVLRLFQTCSKIDAQTDAGQMVITVIGYNDMQADSGPDVTQQSTQKRRSTDAKKNEGESSSKEASPENSLRKEIFDHGKRLLTSGQEPMTAGRAGGWLTTVLKDYGDTALMAAIVTAEAESSKKGDLFNPVAYITAILKKKKGGVAAGRNAVLVGSPEWKQAVGEVG